MQLPGDTTHKVHLTAEKETLLITLYAKALDNRSKSPILGDQTADELVSSIDYDFRKFKGSDNDRFVLRARQFDDWIHEFIAKNHNAMVVNLGCGLDTRVFRINPPSEVIWYDLDYPEVVELREKFFAKRTGYLMIASSVTNPEWLENLPIDRPVIVVAEGLLEYLAEEDVQTLLNRLTSHFQHGQIAFDVLNSFAIRSAKSQLEKTTGATFKWAVDDTRAVEKLDPKLRKTAELSVLAVSYIKKLPWIFRIRYTSMRLSPTIRNMLRLLRYQF